MNDVKYPLIVIDGADVMFFNSKEDLKVSLEGIDVAENMYKAFDAEGRKIQLKAVGVKKGRYFVDIGNVEIESIEQKPTHHGELYSLLTYCLNATGYATNLSMKLPELIDICIKTYGHT